VHRTFSFSRGVLTPMIQSTVFATRHIHMSSLHPHQTTYEKGVGWGRTGSVRDVTDGRRQHSIHDL